MNFHRFFSVLAATVIGTVFGLAGAARASIITTSGNDISGLDLSLTVLFSTDAGAGTTSLQYEVSLGDDPGAVWQVIGFSVLRDWSEGPFVSTSSPAGWSVATTDHFVDWQVFTAGSEIDEGQSLSGFDYAYYGVKPIGQFYRYVVTRDGGGPFQVLSDEALFRPAAVVPEPASLVLLGAPILWLVARRSRS